MKSCVGLWKELCIVITFGCGERCARISFSRTTTDVQFCFLTICLSSALSA